MSDLRRLKDGDSSIAALLRSAGEDAPSPAARRAIAGAIGLGAGAAIGAGSASSAAAAAGSAASGGAASGGAIASIGAKASVSIVAKVLIGVALATGVGVAVKHATSSPAVTVASPPVVAVASPSPVTVASPSSAASIAPPAEIPPTPPSVISSPEVTAPRDVVPLHRPARVTNVAQGASVEDVSANEQTVAKDDSPSEPTVATTPAAPASVLADEVKLLDQALGALRRKEGRAALLVLERYAAKFPHGSLVPEATVARVQALLLDSQPEEARKVATEFLRDHADSPLAVRVRRMIDAP
ncbi:hypothetical protein BH11MYX2_BH11MYX2_08180 [soil metagenome]